MGTRIEGLWDCAYCGKKGIKARFDACIPAEEPAAWKQSFTCRRI